MLSNMVNHKLNCANCELAHFIEILECSILIKCANSEIYNLELANLEPVINIGVIILYIIIIIERLIIEVELITGTYHIMRRNRARNKNHKPRGEAELFMKVNQFCRDV